VGYPGASCVEDSKEIAAAEMFSAAAWSSVFALQFEIP
jgi:hypothetical protein